MNFQEKFNEMEEQITDDSSGIVARDLYWSLQPLDVLSNLLSISPYRWTKDGNLKDSNKIHAYTTITLVILGTILSQGIKIGYLFETTELSKIILDFIETFLLLILAIMAIRLAAKGSLARFFKKLEDIDGILFTPATGRTKLLLICILVTMITVTFLMIEMFLQSKLHDPLWVIVVVSVVKYSMYMYKFVVFLQVQTKVKLLEQRFRLLNELLNNTIGNLHSIFETHNSLCDLVDIINGTHGFQILTITLSIIMAILNLLNNGIILILSTVYADEDVGRSLSFEYADLGIQVLLCLGFITMAILIAARCASTVDEAIRTKTIAQKFLLEEHVKVSSGNEGNVSKRKDELSLFIGTGRSPTFSAGGFFPVDYTLLLAIMGAVTSYFIVLLQFANVNGNKIV